MKKTIAAILLLVMMLAICACGKSGATDKGDGNTTVNNGDQESGATIDTGAMILTKIGTVPGDVNFSSGGIITKSEGEKIQVLNQDGASFNDKWYDEVESIISTGICVVSAADTSGKVLLGVVDSLNEKELLPCEAVEVVKLSDRFVLLGYETGLGTSDDRFGTYYTGSGAVYYKGYGKVLDLQKGQIVSGVEINTSMYDVSAAGNMIYVDRDYRTTDVYSADGNLMGTYDYIYAYPESELALQSVEEGVCVYDKDMKLVSTLTVTDFYEGYDAVDGSSRMLIHEYVKDGSRYRCVTDLNGKAITPEYAKILEVYPEGYLHVIEDDVSKIVDFSGKVMISGFDSVRYAEPGYFVVRVQEEGYFVYDSTGKKINETAMADGYSGLVIEDSAGKVLIFETGEILAADGYAREQTGSLVLIDSTLYDVISGKTVLTEVDSCVATGGNLYVWDNETETYTRYAAEFKAAG